MWLGSVRCLRTGRGRLYRCPLRRFKNSRYSSFVIAETVVFSSTAAILICLIRFSSTCKVSFVFTSTFIRQYVLPCQPNSSTIPAHPMRCPLLGRTPNGALPWQSNGLSIKREAYFAEYIIGLGHLFA